MCSLERRDFLKNLFFGSILLTTGIKPYPKMSNILKYYRETLGVDVDCYVHCLDKNPAKVLGAEFRFKNIYNSVLNKAPLKLNTKFIVDIAIEDKNRFKMDGCLVEVITIETPMFTYLHRGIEIRCRNTELVESDKSLDELGGECYIPGRCFKY